MPSLGPLELLVVMVVALMVFGPNRLPEVGRQVGRGIRELRKLQDTIRDEMNDIMHSVDTPSPAAPPTAASTPREPTERPARTDAAVPTGVPAPSRFRAPRA
ncbi:MAG: twin-arginine translocase TatA/TatE family subunit [Acidimicrobiia bacterium]|nr:twin-arginine translocase TatA/TatE family subunit [Acidimicrobiia bacterium]